MKRYVLALVVIFAFLDLNGQDRGLSLELKIYAEGAHYWPASYKSEPKFALGGGVFLEMPLNNTFSVQLGALYKNRGGIRTQRPPLGYWYASEGQYTVSYQYLSVPVLLKGHLNNFFASVGPSIDFYIGSQTSYVNRINTSIYGAVGYRISLSKDLHLNLEANYNQILLPVYKEYGQEYAYNYGLGFSVGYKL